MQLQVTWTTLGARSGNIEFALTLQLLISVLFACLDLDDLCQGHLQGGVLIALQSICLHFYSDAQVDHFKCTSNSPSNNVAVLQVSQMGRQLHPLF